MRTRTMQEHCLFSTLRRHTQNRATTIGSESHLEYDDDMRELLQFGTLLFLLATFLAPLAECFDRWDAPGISNDTEFAVFALVFALCLVLVVCLLIAARSLIRNLVFEHLVQQSSDEHLPIEAKLLLSIFIPPRLLPLQI